MTCSRVSVTPWRTFKGRSGPAGTGRGGERGKGEGERGRGEGEGGTGLHSPW